MHDLLVLEQAAIARQQHALLVGRDARQVMVVVVVAIERVETQQTQVRGKLAQVGVGHEGHRRRRWRA